MAKRKISKRTIHVGAPTVSSIELQKSDKILGTEIERMGWKRETQTGDTKTRRYDWVKHPYGSDYSKFGDYYQVNTYLANCVDLLSEYAAYDYSITPVDDEKENDAIRARVQKFYDNAGRNKPFTHILQATVKNWQTMGNGMQELVLNAEGQGQELRYHNSLHVHVRRDQLMYRVKYGQTERYVLPYWLGLGDAIPGNGETYKKYFEKSKDPHFNSPKFIPESRLIHFADPHPNNDFYGHPKSETLLRAIIGNSEAGDFNIAKFENKQMGDWGVIISPKESQEFEVKFDEKEMEAAEAKIRAHFHDAANRGPGRVLVMRSPSHLVSITMQRLDTEIKEAHFRMYRRDNKYEIIERYRVPSILIGLVDSGGLSGSWEQVVEVFKQTVMDPLQNNIEWIYYQINKRYLDADMYELELTRLDTRNLVNLATLSKQLSDMYGETPRTIMDKFGIEPPETDTGWLDVPVKVLDTLLDRAGLEFSEKFFGIEIDEKDKVFYDDILSRLNANNNGQNNENGEPEPVETGTENGEED